MNKDLKDLIDDYIKEFLSQEEVKKYFILENQINNSSEISFLRENLKNSQKDLALSLNDEEKYSINLVRYKQAKESFESNPLITNYNSIKKDIYLKLKNLETKIKRLE